MLDKYEADWILNELAELRREVLGRINDIEARLPQHEHKTPVDHEKVAENVVKHTEEAIAFFRQT